MVGWILAAVLAVVLFAGVCLCEELFGMAFVRGKRFPSKSSGFTAQIAEHADMVERGKAFYAGVSKEDVWIESFDGLRLHGVLLKNGESDRLVISAHGYRSGAVHDFSAVLPFLYEKNCNILLIDQRAHGESEGKYITFGVLERRDLRGWVDFALRRFGNQVQILLHGISMGATTVLMASSQDLPENVRGIVADSGFISPCAIFEEVMRKSFGLKPLPLMSIVGGMARRRAHFDIRAASTVDALKSCTVPVLFVHGEADDFVPIRMSEENYAACPTEKGFVRIPGAMHGCGYLVDPDTCEDALSAFLNRIYK